jgi:hypothetical protein
MVEQNTSQVSNDLYSMEKVKERIKTEREKGIKKSLALLLPKKIKIRIRG